MAALQPPTLHRNGAATQTNAKISLTSAVETPSALILLRVGGYVEAALVEYDDGLPSNGNGD